MSVLPLSFWVVICLLIGGGAWAWKRVRDGSGIAMLAVLGTVAFWYVGDAFYNDYANHHAKLFGSATLAGAWWQVAWFLVIFLVVTPVIHRKMNARYIAGGSGMLRMFQKGVDEPVFQAQMSLLLKGSILVWLTLVVVATVRLKEEIPYYFFPFLGHKAEPWAHARVGSGFSFLVAIALFAQQLVTAIFGVVAALSTDRRTRTVALICSMLTLPYFIFDRTRNLILTAIVPGVLSWGLLRMRGSMVKKAAVLGICYLLINAWMSFVIENRSNMSIVAALREKGFHVKGEERGHHEGLNMFEELCWISKFIDAGTYKVNWGERYFAELVNPIPRGLWPGKPEIGYDYAIARGAGSDSGSGLVATISTGVIGEGVVNFGRFLGPASAALLMALWAAVLARLDLQIAEVGRLPVLATGLITTLNLGRDICFMLLYPFLFGMLLLWCIQRYYGTAPKKAGSNHPSTVPTSAPTLTAFRKRQYRRTRYPSRVMKWADINRASPSTGRHVSAALLDQSKGPATSAS